MKAISALVKLGFLLLAITALLGISTFVAAQVGAPRGTGTQPETVRDWLVIATWIAGGLTLAIVALLLVFVLSIILMWVFVPAVLRKQARAADWIRTIVMPVGSVSCFIYLTWFSQEEWIPGIRRVQEHVQAWAQGHDAERLVGLTAIRIACDVSIALVAATTVYVAVMAVCGILLGLSAALRRYIGLAGSAATAVSGFFKRLWEIGRKEPITATGPPLRGQGQLAPILSGCLLLNLTCLPFFLVRGDWVAFGIGVIGGAVTISLLHVILAADPAARASAPLTGALPAAGLALAAVAFLFVPGLGPPGGDGVIPLPADAWRSALRVILRDVVFAIALTLLIVWLLTRGWPANSDDVAGIRRHLWRVIGGYLLLKALAILVTLGAAFFFDPLPQGEQAEANLRLLDPKVVSVDPAGFVYMAWSGNVLQGTEFLFARWQQHFAQRGEKIEDRVEREAFKAEAEKYRSYYEQRFALLVVLQIVFGWHYGITPLCYLLFAFALFVFRYPEPKEGEKPEAYVARKRDSGALDRIRETANAIVTLGFVGTLLGLSQSIFFLGTGDALTEYLRQSSISSRLTGSLGLGFFVTFVSMILRLALFMRFSQLAGTNQGYQRQLQVLAEQG